MAFMTPPWYLKCSWLRLFIDVMFFCDAVSHAKGVLNEAREVDMRRGGRIEVASTATTMQRYGAEECGVEETRRFY